jgi:hydrogenase maturation protein HypF
MAEHNLQGTALGVAWDGAGLGDDGTMWGGEFLQVKPGNYHRVAHLRQFRLPGGEAATREPRRSAIGLLWALDGSLSPSRAALTPITESTAEERQVLCRMLDSGLNAPITSSAGRLFDAVAALIGLRQRSNYQGQAAAELEWAINTSETDQRYSFETPTNNAPTAEKPRVLDWGPMMHELISDIAARTPQSLISAKFHNTLVELIVSVIEWQQIDNVVFGGGCFQNKYLTGRLMQRLLAMGVKPFFPQTIPPNDGGLSLGQIYWARHILSGE